MNGCEAVLREVTPSYTKRSTYSEERSNLGLRENVLERRRLLWLRGPVLRLVPLPIGTSPQLPSFPQPMSCRRERHVSNVSTSKHTLMALRDECDRSWLVATAR